MKKWRLLTLSVNDAFMNMAVDEAIVVARIKNLIPNTLRFYRWNPSAVSLGRFQDEFKEVNIQDCRNHGVDIVRRISGGGAVYHDRNGEITYSIVAGEKDFGTADVVQTYNEISQGIIEAAKMLGVNATFSPGDLRNCPNIAINGKKFSGSAQFHKGGVLLQHGTFLLDVDLRRMFTFLRVPWAQTMQEVVCVAQDKLTSIGKELDRKVGVQEAYDTLVQGFRKALNLVTEEESLTPCERRIVSRLLEEKYSKDSWNLRGIIQQVQMVKDG